MCDPREAKDREESRDLSVFERIPGTGSSEHGNTPLVDYDLAVKKFKRPAAGKSIDPSTVRTPETLTRVVNYLVFSVLDRTEVDFREVFLFLSDRFRAVRGDFSCQGIKTVAHVSALETIVRFHLYSMHALLDVPDVAATQNITEGTKALTSLLELYDDGVPSPHEDEFRAYNLLFSVQKKRGHEQHTMAPIAVLAKLSARSLESPLVESALGALTAIHANDWARFFKSELPCLPFLQACAVLPSLPVLRKCAVASIAFAVRSDYSLPQLATTLLLSVPDAAALCQSLGHGVRFAPSNLPPDADVDAARDACAGDCSAWYFIRTKTDDDWGVAAPPPRRLFALDALCIGLSRADIVAPGGAADM